MTDSWGDNESFDLGSLQTLDCLLTLGEPVPSFTTQARLDLILDLGCGSRDPRRELGGKESKHSRRVLSDGDGYRLTRSGKVSLV